MATTHTQQAHPLRHGLFVGFEVLASFVSVLIIVVLAAGGLFAYNLFSNVTELDLKKAPGYAPAGVLEPEKTESKKLQNLLNEYSKNLPTDAGIVVHNLKTTEHAEIGSHKKFVTASMYKLFVAHEVLRHIESGEMAFTDDAGNETGKNIDQCMRVMIMISDNDCGIALGRKIDFEASNSSLHSVGFNETDLTRYQMATTADDIYVYFSHLYNGTTLEKESQEYLLNLLENQRVNDRLSKGLPSGTKFAHKTGNLWGRFHDGGIVYRHGDYIIVMLAGPWNSLSQAQLYFEDLAKRVDGYFAKNS